MSTKTVIEIKKETQFNEIFKFFPIEENRELHKWQQHWVDTILKREAKKIENAISDNERHFLVGPDTSHSWGKELDEITRLQGLILNAKQLNFSSFRGSLASSWPVSGFMPFTGGTSKGDGR